ncbi:tellurite resistance TerB family protein [Hoeflea prorocentri]|uniref:DUF533 domain-containing protein n=1 Tax=Hoeflea prorocentri TaxID=1922333 RepID=A0A9X3UIC6_9HYPH|nr:DUF533 domain-containing protein [Hoeflea prorocentri]MCY6381204.1 DUF533 domain-containing protein [Hoeflea prorocentri]MDA5399004.1 DUF533 domain-containing protein [Hoeflea prorocentri]
MTINQLLGQFLGGGQSGEKADTSASPVAQLLNPAGLGGGLAAGGLIGLLAGNKKMRKKAAKYAGGAAAIGGGAALAAITFRAFSNWQDKTRSSQAGAPAPAAPIADKRSLSQFDPETSTGADGTPFQFALVKAIITAANADGHIDADERKTIKDAIATMQLDEQSNMLIFDTLSEPPDVDTIAGYANGLGQASEIYLVSRMVLDTDNPDDLSYLQALVKALALPRDLVLHLEEQLSRPAHEAA